MKRRNTPRPRTTPRDRAVAWWKKHVDAKRYVLPAGDVPSPAMARVLRHERLILEVANKRAVILTTPDRIDERTIFLRNYWAIVNIVLERYAPAGVAGIEAVRLHLGEATPPRILPVVHAANQSEYRLDLFDDLAVRLRPGSVAAGRLVHLPAGAVEVPVLGPADLLVTLDLQEIELDVPAVTAWLRHLVIRSADLDAAAAVRPRAKVLTRLAVLAKELRNTRLARQIDEVVNGISEYPISVSATGVATRIVVPEPIATIPAGSGSPWLDRQAMALARHRDIITPILEKIAGAPPDVPMRTLIAHARRAKSYDAYHNTTIEGYRISKEKSDAVVNGHSLPDASSEDEFRAMVAVQGYSRAFDRVLVLAQSASPPTITGDLSLDLYGELFSPSVDAGLFAPEDLRRWRNGPVGLDGGWRHVPPNHKKVPDLIEGLTTFLADKAISALARAVLAHLEFVTIHPFYDGNGRVARLLMNYALLHAGYPWVTIRTDERIPYFKALERAQVDENASELGRFLGHYIAQATADVSKTRPASRRR